MFCRIYPRPGLSLKPPFLGGGVIDSDYRGNISVILTSFSSWTVEINRGDRIAQIMFFKKEEVDFEESMNLTIGHVEVGEVLVQQAYNLCTCLF